MRGNLSRPRGGARVAGGLLACCSRYDAQRAALSCRRPISTHRAGLVGHVDPSTRPSLVLTPARPAAAMSSLRHRSHLQQRWRHVGVVVPHWLTRKGHHRHDAHTHL